MSIFSKYQINIQAHEIKPESKYIIIVDKNQMKMDDVSHLLDYLNESDVDAAAVMVDDPSQVRIEIVPQERVEAPNQPSIITRSRPLAIDTVVPQSASTVEVSPENLADIGAGVSIRRRLIHDVIFDSETTDLDKSMFIPIVDEAGLQIGRYNPTLDEEQPTTTLPNHEVSNV
jgi:hypothetical protein